MEGGRDILETCMLELVDWRLEDRQRPRDDKLQRMVITEIPTTADGKIAERNNTRPGRGETEAEGNGTAKRTGRGETEERARGTRAGNRGTYIRGFNAGPASGKL